MIQKIKKALLTTLAISFLGAPVLVPVVAHAADGDPINCGVRGEIGVNCPDNPDAEPTINKAIKTGLNLFSGIVGIISVVMVIVGGIRYITSGGDSGKVASAQNTVLYAVIGLVVVALAQIIVQFVLKKFTS